MRAIYLTAAVAMSVFATTLAVPAQEYVPCDTRCDTVTVPAMEAGQRSRSRLRQASLGEGRVVGGRPSACYKWPKTSRLYCGCASALEVGLANHDGRWNLARNWFKLPRSAPGHNKVAVRSGHVAVLKYQISGSVWMAYDPNSGGGLTRIHPIDLRSYRAVVDPHRGATASLSARQH